MTERGGVGELLAEQAPGLRVVSDNPEPGAVA
jgi:hypothetical protein